LLADLKTTLVITPMG